MIPRILVTMVLPLLGQELPPAATGPVDYEKDVQPLLRKRCYGCHGPAQQISGLRLDDGPSAKKGGYSGPAFQPKNSAASALILRVAGVKGVQAMPPGGPKLTAEEIGILRAWIDRGAEFPAAAVTSAKPKSSHWSFQRIERPAVPGVKTAGWVRNPIDGFVLARLEAEGMTPSPEAARATLLRRLSLDLTGLLPTPQEVAEFLADTRPDAYERQVDRLLASPHYGEKWARHWLDLARYADSDGYEKDWVRPYAWRYRHWVINALNEDLPFDRFTIAQLAGDLLPHATVEDKVATGFNRMTLTNREGGIDNEQFRYENNVDRVNTLGATWLGLTTGCTQCHDHKYDPITQKDYYSLMAFFDSMEEVDIDAPLPGEMGPWLRSVKAYRAERTKLLEEYNVPALQAAWEKDILYTIANPGKRTDWDLAWDCVLKLTEGGDGGKIVQIAPEKRTQREQDILTDHFVRNYHFAVGNKRYTELKLKELDEKLTGLKQKYPQLTQAMAIAEMRAPRQSHLKVRGDYKNDGIPVNPETPAVLPPLRTGGRASRLDLAKWLVSRENPLTARVTVNRYWQELFGQGIVKTPEDFGSKGAAPTHRELLDWLAAELMENGWSQKQMLRTMVTSATYRQASKVRPDVQTKDPNNLLLARQARLRLSAELVRDAALFSSGLLSLEVGGKSVRPPQPKGVMDLGYGGGKEAKWRESDGPDRYRRGLYIQFLRTTPYPLLMNFDGAKAVVAQCKRERSDTSLQALNLLNDPVFLEAAQALAARVQSERPGDFAEQLRYAYQVTLNRDPNPREVAKLGKYVERQREILAKETGGGEYNPWVGLASVLLNLDEFITRE